MGLAEKIRAFWNATARACDLSQRRCHFCLSPYEPDNPGSVLCPACRMQLAPYAGPRCSRCGLPLGAFVKPDSAAPANGLCGDCSGRLPPFDRCAYYGLYAGSLRELILQFKFHNHYWLGPVLGHFLAEASVCLPAPDALLAVPLHDSRLRERGFNQAHELARFAARLGGWPLLGRALQRHGQGKIQALLDARERKRNVAGIFWADGKYVAGKRLWLIDDIVTTGNTAIAAASALLAAGACEINVLCVARTPRFDR